MSPVSTFRKYKKNIELPLYKAIQHIFRLSSFLLLLGTLVSTHRDAPSTR